MKCQQQSGGSRAGLPSARKEGEPSSNSRQAATHHHNLYFVDHRCWLGMAIVV